MSYEILQPSSHYNDETIFTIPSRAQCLIDPDFSLNDIGFYVSTMPAIAASVSYPVTSGIAACIDSIEILDNDQTLEYIQDVADRAAINSMQMTNQDAMNIYSRTQRVRNSYKIENGKICYKDSGVSATLTASTSTTPTGSLALNQYSGVLSAMTATAPRALILSKYHTIEIRIRWNTKVGDALSKFVVQGAGVTTANSADLQKIQLAPVRPCLVYKVYKEKELVKQYEEIYAKGLTLQFETWESESNSLPKATAAGATSTYEYRLRSIPGRFVTRAICQNKYIYNSAVNYDDGVGAVMGLVAWNAYAGTVGNQYSTPMLNESMNIDLNNAIFIDGGVPLPAIKAYHRRLALGSQLQLVTNTDIKKADADEIKTMQNAVVDAHKVQSYYGFWINKPVFDMKVSYTKTHSQTLDFLGTDDTNKGLPLEQIWRWEFVRYLQIKNAVVQIFDSDPTKQKK